MVSSLIHGEESWWTMRGDMGEVLELMTRDDDGRR